MKKVVGFTICSLLAGCGSFESTVVRGPSPGIEYHNQMAAPWPWVFVVPSERALAMKDVDFELISQQLHFDMAFEPHQATFQDVRKVVTDYTIIPSIQGRGKGDEPDRARRYFMTLSFYQIGNSPPCPPDFEVTATLRADKAGKSEAFRFMAHDIVEELHTLCRDGLLTPGKKITVNLD